MDFLKCQGPCKQDRAESFFDIANKQTGKRQPFCRICRREYQNSYYRRTSRAKSIKSARRASKRMAELADFVNDLKKKPCKDCGTEYHPFVMDFDHREAERKVADISSMVRKLKCSREVILQEIEKCDLVCANCHRIRTGRRLGIIAGTEMG